ncbi:MAG TPA: ferritin-like domain-containing protein [Isosphaeraceae bacterium]|jgi:hypothetical protein|nr:ferritin-like domain-containing protein [Isosphaeraceae bacterium]
MRRLKFEPRVKVLSDQQIHEILSNPTDPEELRDPARRSFLGLAAKGAALAVPALMLGSSSHAATKKKAATLPQLFAGQNTSIFQQILADESAHVEILQKLLIDKDDHLPTRPVPHFRNLEQHSLLAFVRGAATFENTGAGTYSGALFAIQQTEEYFPVAAGLATVEARHAAFINALLNEPLVPDFAPVDSPIDQSVALSRIDPFILDLNGGTVPSFDPLNASNDNNFAIEDFLLLLEFVETAFYQVNVAKFFG